MHLIYFQTHLAEVQRVFDDMKNMRKLKQTKLNDAIYRNMN